MSGPESRPRLEPFFLATSSGERFCVVHIPVGQPRGAVLYLHPFAEEMNKSRRMAALQARALAASGSVVLQIDLFGCGDSSGDFADATWEIWKRDAVLAAQWLFDKFALPVTFWGLRLGALLALASAPACARAPRGFILWQPLINGEQAITQFLRLRVASAMLAQGKATSGVQELRHALVSGECLEIAGYVLSPGLASSIDALTLTAAPVPESRAHWLELVPDGAMSLPPAAKRAADSWTSRGARLSVKYITGQPFWNTLEIHECPALISETSRILALEHE